jgi:hypothetical protein
MGNMMRYTFLEKIHEILKPRVYLEIGVQFGYSFRLAQYSEAVIGIDPRPLTAPVGNQVIFGWTSDQYFALNPMIRVDLGYIDGDHHYEQVFTDFMNLERCMQPDGILLFDDVLPRTQEIGSRDPIPGDWAGDAYRVVQILRDLRTDLTFTLIDVEPTGLLMVENLDPWYNWGISQLPPDPDPYAHKVPEEILARHGALDGEEVLEKLRVMA